MEEATNPTSVKQLSQKDHGLYIGWLIFTLETLTLFYLKYPIQLDMSWSRNEYYPLFLRSIASNKMDLGFFNDRNK